jgi:hypothetical protein
MVHETRRAEPRDRERILDLVRRCGADARVWTWLAERNPHGAAVTWVATEASGHLQAAVAFFPQRMVFDGRELRGALAAVVSGASSNGARRALVDTARRNMRAQGIEVAVGIGAHGGIFAPRGSGARDVTTAARYVRPVSLRAIGLPLGPVDKLASRVLVPYTRAYVDPATFYDTRVAAIWRDVRDHLGLALARDADFYTWRFVVSPSQAQQAYVIKEGTSPIGACALERVGSRLRIVDLIAKRKHWGAALSAICRLARTDCDAVEMRLTPERARSYALWRHGFVRVFGDDVPVTVIAPEGAVHPALYDARRWYFTGAESARDQSE